MQILNKKHCDTDLQLREDATHQSGEQSVYYSSGTTVKCSDGSVCFGPRCRRQTNYKCVRDVRVALPAGVTQTS